MAEIRNLIKRFSYDEPYSQTCYQKVCAFGKCTKVPYTCFGMTTKVIEIYSVAYYPDEATLQQKAAIVACAGTAVSAAYAACVAAYTAETAGTAGVGAIVGGVAACLTAGESAGRAAFDECKRKNLPQNIASRTGWKIEQKKYNRGEDWVLIEDNPNYDENIQTQLQQRHLYEQEQYLKNMLYTNNYPYPYY
ncbi:TPA: hypothetical protein QCU24_003597 [Bacillus cereus]|nr:hypothetical protein [Bacillus cereus]